MKNPAASPAAGFLRVIGPSPRGGCGRRDALHARAGGTIEPRRGTGTGPGRPYRPPLHAPAAGSGCRGAFYMRPGRTAGIGRLSVIATRSRRHVGMPPYKARRTCSGNRGRFGRIYNPPLQAHTPPFADVGAHSICARAAPPELAGFRSSRPGPGGMWACRPTPAAAGGLPCTQKLAGRCGHRPYGFRRTEAGRRP